MNDYNPDGIIPRIFPPSRARVKDLNLRVRTLVDYDATYMQDRVISTVFVNDMPTGSYGMARFDYWKDNPVEALAAFGPETERMAIEDFLGANVRAQVREQEIELLSLRSIIVDLSAAVDHLGRVRWWQLRRRWADRRDSRAGRHKG